MAVGFWTETSDPERKAMVAAFDEMVARIPRYGDAFPIPKHEEWRDKSWLQFLKTIEARRQAKRH